METNSFGKNPFYRTKIPILEKWIYRLRAKWRHFRVGRLPTKLLGSQYTRSRNKIEIDITYACNLRCYNCNRSVRQAPERLHMPLAMVTDFVDSSISRKKQWKRIRVLGGEPTIHPEFQAIIGELLRYRKSYPNCLIEVVTNGHGEPVEAQLAQLPKDIWVENSRKSSNIQPDFGPFNDAPVDDPRYANKVFRNGCAIVEDCGMGLTPLGYYPCAVAGGMDRVLGETLGRESLPSDGDSMEDILESRCRLCGRFRDGHYVPRNFRPPLTEERISPTWAKIYSEWRERKMDGRPRP